MSRVNLADLTPQPATPAAPAKSKSSLSRRKRKQMSLYLSIAVWRQIRKLAFEEERSIHSCILEALDLLFAHRGLPSSADLEEDTKDV